MKKILFMATIFCISSWHCFGQNVQWTSDGEQSKHTVYTSLGYEFGLVSKLGYGRLINTRMPVVISADYSMPMGKQLSDDFMLRLGVASKLLQKNSLLLSAQVYTSLKRHETALLQVNSLGTDFGLNLSYLLNRWTFSLQFMNTVSLASRLKHSAYMRDNYPQIKDGWYKMTSGQRMYGAQVNRSFGSGLDLSFNMGLVNARGKDIDALLPYYAHVVLSKRF